MGTVEMTEPSVKTSAPEDSMPTAKEYDIPKQKQPSPEDPTQTGNKTEVAHIETNESPAKEKRKDVTDSPKEKEMAKLSEATKPKEKLTERAETTEEQKHSHFYDSGLTEQDAQKKLVISVEESTIQEGNVDVLVENSDVARKEEVDQCLQERKTVEKPDISMHAADVKDANDSIYEQMHPKERTEKAVENLKLLQKEETELEFPSSQENQSSNHESKETISINPKSTASKQDENQPTEKLQVAEVGKSKLETKQPGSETMEKGGKEILSGMSRVNSGSSNESCTRRTDATNEHPERETRRKKKKKRSDRVSKDIEINFEEPQSSKQEFPSRVNKDVVLSSDSRALSSKPDEMEKDEQKKESSEDSKEGHSLTKKESEQKQDSVEKERNTIEKPTLKIKSDEIEKSKVTKLEDEGEENERNQAEAMKLKRSSQGEDLSKETDSKQEDKKKNLNQTKQSKIKRRSCPVEDSEHTMQIGEETEKKETPECLIKASEVEE